MKQFWDAEKQLEREVNSAYNEYEKELFEELSKSLPVHIARDLGIGRSTVYKILKEPKNP